MSDLPELWSLLLLGGVRFLLFADFCCVQLHVQEEGMSVASEQWYLGTRVDILTGTLLALPTE